MNSFIFGLLVNIREKAEMTTAIGKQGRRSKPRTTAIRIARRTTVIVVVVVVMGGEMSQ